MTQPVTHGRLRILADPAWGWCAGLRHPPEAEYPAGRFTPVQIDQLRADPALTLVDMDEADAFAALAAQTRINAFALPTPSQIALRDLVERAVSEGWSADQLRLAIEQLDAASVGAPSPADGAATAGDAEGVAGTNPEAEVAASNRDPANGDVAPAQEADAPAAASASAPRGRRAR